MERVCVTEAEIVEALQASLDAMPAGDDGLTMAEMEAVTGVGEKRLRRAFRALREAGRLEVGRRPSTSITGARVFTPVYRVKP